MRNGRSVPRGLVRIVAWVWRRRGERMRPALSFPPRADAGRPNLAALSEAEVCELTAIGAVLRPTRDDPFGAAALTTQQVARVRALAAKAWDAT
jgi:hypothetical protein